MKRYTDYQKGELATLTDEQIQRLIDIEIAEAGIKPVPEPVKPTLADVGIKPTDHYYQLKGVGYGACLIKGEEDAKKLLEMVVFEKEYDYQVGDAYSWAQKADVQLVQISLFRKEDIDKIKHTLRENRTLQEQYKKDSEAYKKYTGATHDCRVEVHTAVDNDRNHVRMVKLAMDTWTHYLSLAEGDKEVAERFFRNAYRDDIELIEVVLGQATPPPEGEDIKR